MKVACACALYKWKEFYWIHAKFLLKHKGFFMIYMMKVNWEIGFWNIIKKSKYKRLGILSLLAGLDLFTGEIISLVSDTHKSSGFIEWLKLLDSRYPEYVSLLLVFNNHSAHTSKVIQKYLTTKPGRFEFVFTPKRGSWLNLIEIFFGKIAKQCLKGIRVSSK